MVQTSKDISNLLKLGERSRYDKMSGSFDDPQQKFSNNARDDRDPVFLPAHRAVQIERTWGIEQK